MSQSVCLYSELESYSGSISHNPSDLARLIWDLELACLFYDVIIVHRRNIWEHPLTLPAFEILAPFVKCGQLWTSANEFDQLPKDYVEQKAQQLEHFFCRGYVKKINAVDDIKERWLRIIPVEWKIHRCASKQATRVLKNIGRYLSKFKDNKFRQLHPLLDFVQRMRADNDFDKEATLAKVGILRGLLHPALLSEIATLIQTEFVRAGANFNEAVIYPGKSAQCLTNLHFGPLPFAHQTLHQVKERINSVSFNLDELINLPVPMLFEITQSKQWLMIRNALLNDIFEAEIQQQMRSVFSTNLSFQNQLEKLLNISCQFKKVENPTPHLSPIFMPSPWALVSQSLLGNASVAAPINVKKASNTFILDLESRVLYDENSPSSQVKLSQQQTNLLSILVNDGKLGLTVELMKQWLIELDALKEEYPKWESLAELNPERDDRFFLLRNRIDVLKRDINKKLKPLGLRIGGETGKGRWYLETENAGTNLTLKLAGTAWEKFEKREAKDTPPGLSPQSKLIWNCLQEYYPGFVSAKALAEILGTEWDGEKTGKQISKAIYKLKNQLKNENWTIMSDTRGKYTIIPKPLSDDSTTTENGAKTAI